MTTRREWLDEPEIFDAVYGCLDAEAPGWDMTVRVSSEEAFDGSRGAIMISRKRRPLDGPQDGRKFRLVLEEVL